jgi:hypothetical protein
MINIWQIYIIYDYDVRWNILDNTITGNTWLRFTKEHNKYKLNIFHAVKASSGEHKLVLSAI